MRGHSGSYGAAGADIGAKVYDGMHMYGRLLFCVKLMVNTVFAKMPSGEEAKKQFSNLDTGVKVDLPD